MTKRESCLLENRTFFSKVNSQKQNHSIYCIFGPFSYTRSRNKVRRNILILMKCNLLYSVPISQHSLPCCACVSCALLWRDLCGRR